MILVCDTSPLVALAKIALLWLLPALYEDIRIPPRVRVELLAKQGSESPALEKALQTFLAVYTPTRPSVQLGNEIAHLASGEAEAVALATQCSAVLLIDDHQGRATARRLSVPVVGTTAILLEAKRRGLVPAVLPLLHQLRSHGYWLSDALLRTAARLADE